MAEPHTIHDAAIAYVQHGRRVLLLYGINPATGGCTCSKGLRCEQGPGKHIHYKANGWRPDLKRRGLTIYDLPMATTYDVDLWFMKWPHSNIGLATGGSFGVVLDLDTPKEKNGWRNGREEWHKLQEIYGQAPPTLIARTGSGGLHLVYRDAPGHQTVGKLPLLRRSRASGVIDTKGHHCYIAADPSMHVSGERYHWINEGHEIAELPSWLYETPDRTDLLGAIERRKPRKRGSAPRRIVLAEGESDLLDQRARERLADVDPGAVLSRLTLDLIESGDFKDRSLTLYRIILGGASVRFDPDKLYDRIMAGAMGEALAEKGGRSFFDMDMLAAHRWLSQPSLVIEELRHRKIIPGDHIRFGGRYGRHQSIRRTNLIAIWECALNFAEESSTLAPTLWPKMISNRTKLHIDTVRKGLQAIESLGLWEAEDNNTDGRQAAYRYHFCVTEPIPTGKARPLQKKARPSGKERFAEFMQVRSGPVPFQEVVVFGEANDISKRALQRYARALGIISEKSTFGGQAAWRMPSQAPRSSPEASQGPETVHKDPTEAGLGPESLSQPDRPDFLPGNPEDFLDRPRDPLPSHLEEIRSRILSDAPGRAQEAIQSLVPPNTSDPPSGA